MRTLTDRKWKGYTLDELQTQRQINDKRIEAQKMLLAADVDSVKNRESAKSGIFKKFVNSLSYLDYAVLGVSAFKRISSLISLFRKKK